MKETTERHYQSLREIARVVNSGLPVRDILDLVVRDAAKGVNASGSSIMLLGPSQKHLVHTAAHGLSDWYLRKGFVDVDKSLSETLAGKAVAVLDTTTDDRIQYRELAEQAGIASIFGVPLWQRGRVVGALRVYTHERREFSPEDRDFLAAVAELIALALENARLSELVSGDYDQAKKDAPESEGGGTRLALELRRPPSFAHPSEEEFAKLLDFYRIEWLYEPRSFPLQWEGDRIVEMFTPDFYLPELDLYIELTTLKQSLATEKNRKLRQLKQLYPEVNIRLLNKSDYLKLLAKYGYGPLGGAKVQGIERVLFSQTQIQRKVRTLGKRISRDYAGRQLLLVGILKGVVPFMADLIRHISLPLTIEFMAISYYGGDDAQAVKITKDLDSSITGLDVLMIEDIVDTGMTLNYILHHLSAHNPASLRVCTLLDKRVRRLVDVPLEYVGFEVSDEFVVGYGLDYRGEYRNLPFIGVLHPPEME